MNTLEHQLPDTLSELNCSQCSLTLNAGNKTVCQLNTIMPIGRTVFLVDGTRGDIRDRILVGMQPDVKYTACVYAPDFGLKTTIGVRGNKMELSILTLDLLDNTKGILLLSGIKTIGDLVSKSEAELSEIPRLGKAALSDIKHALINQDIKLR